MPCTYTAPCGNVLRFIARRFDGAEIHECLNAHTHILGVPRPKPAYDPREMCGHCIKRKDGSPCAVHDTTRVQPPCFWCRQSFKGKCVRHGGAGRASGGARRLRKGNGFAHGIRPTAGSNIAFAKRPR